MATGWIVEEVVQLVLSILGVLLFGYELLLEWRVVRAQRSMNPVLLLGMCAKKLNTCL